MDLAGKVVFLALFTYFAYRCAMSIEKLNKGDIGTIINRKRYFNFHFSLMLWTTVKIGYMVTGYMVKSDIRSI